MVGLGLLCKKRCAQSTPLVKKLPWEKENVEFIQNLKSYPRISLEICDFLKRDHVFRVLRFIIPFWGPIRWSHQYLVIRPYWVPLNTSFNLPIWRISDPDQLLDRSKSETRTFRKISRNVWTTDLTYLIRREIFNRKLLWNGWLEWSARYDQKR